VNAEAHTFPIRIYYEDTDHGGVVYYANYLKFMERARTEFLRSLGLELDELESTFGILFAVTEIHVHFRNSARFNDALTVESKLMEAHGARLAFQQNILRENELLIEGEVRLACMDRTGRPSRIPAKVMRFIEPTLAENATVKE